MAIRKRRPAPGSLEAAIEENLKQPQAREAFEKICKDGMERERLASIVLALRTATPTRKRFVFRNPKVSQSLSRRLLALARDLDALDRIHISVAAARRSPIANRNDQPITIPYSADSVDLNEFFSTLTDAPQSRQYWPEEFDFDLLRKQLRAGAVYFRALAKGERPGSFRYPVEYMDPEAFVREVEGCTGDPIRSRRYAVPCRDLGNWQLTEEALNMRRSRSGTTRKKRTGARERSK